MNIADKIVEWAKECQNQEVNGYFDKNGIKIEVGERVFDADPFFAFEKDNASAYGTIIEENSRLFIKWDLDDEPTALLDASMLEIIPKVKKGDTILIKDNLLEQLVESGFNREGMKGFVNRFVGTKQTAYDVYFDVDNGTKKWWATVDLCCEIPLNACELA